MRKGWKFFSKSSGLEVFEGVSKGKKELSGCVFLTVFELEKGGTQLTIKLDPPEVHFLSRAILGVLKNPEKYQKYQTFIYHSVDEGKTSSSLSLKMGKVGLLVKVTKKNGDEKSIVVPISKENALYLAELLKSLSIQVAWIERVETKTQKEETPEPDEGSPEESPTPPEPTEIEDIEDIDF